MALLAALTPKEKALEGDGGNTGVSSQIQVVVAMATPTDLMALKPDNQESVAKFLHASAQEDRNKWEFASPIHHVVQNESDRPEVLLLHGAADDSVDANQSSEFARRYRASRVGNYQRSPACVLELSALVCGSDESGGEILEGGADAIGERRRGARVAVI